MAEPLSSLPASSSGKPIPWPDSKQNLSLVKVSQRTPGQQFHEAFEGVLSGIRRYWAGAERGATRVVSRSRNRMTRLRRERPLQLVAGVAITAFLVGAALRVWRRHYE